MVSNPPLFRIVMNGAVRFQGMSINDCLVKGPEHSGNFLGGLLRFRQYTFAFMADIESMYLQYRVLTVNKSSLKFL